MPVIDAGAPPDSDPADGSIQGVVTRILTTIADTTPAVRRALGTHRDAIASENPSGERQLAADTYTDRLLEERLLALEGVGAYASEEREGISRSGEGLSIAVDPLDGSGNLASNNGLGTIIGIYDGTLPARGADLVAAATVTYGPTTMLVTARNDTVSEYLVESGTPTLLRTDVTIPEEPDIFALGGREWEWDTEFQSFADAVRQEYKLRYTGAVIMDLNRILENGGVYAYPPVESYPNGKPRHQFEAAPVGYIVETAGGRASDGDGSVLSSSVTDIHARSPLCIGNAGLVDRYEETQ